MKRTKLWALAAAVLLCAALPMLTASAEEPETRWVEADLSPYLIQAGGFPAERAELCAETGGDVAGARTAILKCLRNFEEEIDLSPYQVDAGQFWSFYYNMVNDNPSLFYVAPGCSYEGGTYVTRFRPYYKTDIYPDLKAAVATYEARVQRAMASIEGLTDPLDKIIALHDYLAVRAAYDYPAYNDWQQGIIQGHENAYNAYGIMVNDLGVCQGYTLAFADLLQRAGVPVGYAHGPNHIWNMVQVDGQWYNIDLTWDDCMETSQSGNTMNVSRPCFMLSTAELAERDRQGQNCHRAEGDEAGRYDHSATDTTYDNYWWSCVTGQLIPDGAGGYVYTEWDGLKRRSADGTVTTLYEVRNAGSPSLYRGSYYFLVNTVGDPDDYTVSYRAADVMCYDPKQGTARSVYHLESDKCVMVTGCLADNGDLHLATRVLELIVDYDPCDNSYFEKYGSLVGFGDDGVMYGDTYPGRTLAGALDGAPIREVSFEWQPTGLKLWDGRTLAVDSGAVCYAVRYDGDGRMAALERVTNDGTGCIRFTRTVGPGWKLCFLTEAHKPLTMAAAV